MILKNCRLIPELCEGFELERADIRIEDKTIAEILPAGGNYSGEEVIDCAGRTVMPGLFDLHCHLLFTDFAALTDPLPLQTEAVYLTKAIHYMYSFLRYGYTSLRDVGCAYNIAGRLRDLVNAGKMIGPDITTSGIILMPDFISGLNAFFSNNYGMPVNNPYEVRAAVRKNIAEGADFIKILGSNNSPDLKRGRGSVFYEDEMEELASCVKKEGTYFASHSITEQANETSLRHGVGTLEHCLCWNRDNMDLLIKMGYKTAVVPTTAISVESGFGYENNCGIKIAAEDKNIKIGFGADSPEFIFVANPEREFVAREKMLGWSRIDILKQATIINHTINGTDKLQGTIKVGKIADIIVIDGNPDEDLTVFHNAPAYVLKNGVVVAQNGFVKM